MVVKGKLNSSAAWVRPLAGLLALTAACAAVVEPAAAAEASAAVPATPFSPRKTIAVSGFDAAGGFLLRYGDAGATLGTMLASELARSNRFILVERADLDALLRENSMAQQGVTTAGTGRPLLGAQILVRGTVTEFEEQERGGGLNLSFTAGGMLGGLGQNRTSGRIAITLRVIDAASGAVIATHNVERRFSSSSVNLQAQTRGVSLGTSGFEQAAVGRAAREAIAEAARTLVAATERVPWQASVAEVDADRVYISAGLNANLAPGARLRAVRTERSITDPSTGALLGNEQRTIGDLVIESVHDRYAVGRLIAPAALERGDIVHLLGS